MTPTNDTLTAVPGINVGHYTDLQAGHRLHRGALPAGDCRRC